MDGGRFPGVSTNCRWAGGSRPQRGEGHSCPNAWCHCYSNQTCSLIHTTPGPDSLWGLCPESLAVVQAGPSFSTVSFLDSESGQWGTGVPHLESLLGSPLGAQDSPHLILLLSVPIFHLHPWLPLPPDSVSWPKLTSTPSELEQVQAHLVQLSTLPAPAHQRLHVATHQESGEDKEDEGGCKEAAEGHTSGGERHD